EGATAAAAVVEYSTFSRLLLELRFEDREPLGSGGFGQVWRAVWLNSDSTRHGVTDDGVVAVKLPHNRDDSSIRSQFHTEAHLQMSMKHPNILTCFAYCPIVPIVVMEYCSNGTLARVLEELRNDDDEKKKEKKNNNIHRVHMSIGGKL